MIPLSGSLHWCLTVPFKFFYVVSPSSVIRTSPTLFFPLFPEYPWRFPASLSSFHCPLPRRCSWFLLHSSYMSMESPNQMLWARWVLWYRDAHCSLAVLSRLLTCGKVSSEMLTNVFCPGSCSLLPPPSLSGSCQSVKVLVIFQRIIEPNQGFKTRFWGFKSLAFEFHKARFRELGGPNV